MLETLTQPQPPPPAPTSLEIRRDPIRSLILAFQISIACEDRGDIADAVSVLERVNDQIEIHTDKPTYEA